MLSGLVSVVTSLLSGLVGVLIGTPGGGGTSGSA